MIEIHNVKKSFKKRDVLNGISLSILRGEKVSLLGQNGSGKTTLIRCLLGLYYFDGSIKINGLSIHKNRTEVLNQVAFVPQIPPPLKNTVEDIIFQNTVLGKIKPNKIECYAEGLGLNIKPILNQSFKNLSGGMKQKLLIANALARDPKILIMDEPAANLDPIARGQFFSFLKKLPSDTLLLLTSHRIDELSEIVTRSIELDMGTVSLDEIFVQSEQNQTPKKYICGIHFNQISDHIVKTLNEWGFTSSLDNKNSWSGVIYSINKYKYYSMITRWNSFIVKSEIREEL